MSENIGFEEKLWAMADKLRGSMDALEYNYVGLGYCFYNMYRTHLKSYMIN